MVFFTCNVCGEALKKNQVDKHCMKCRNCQSVSCMDCGKDFWGNEYEQHTKCISEDQKYSGKDYVPKVNKGEVKQDRWIEQVQTAIEKHKGDPRLRSTLETIKNYPNIPRKKAKFENFLSNSLKVRDKNLMTRLWEAIMVDKTSNGEAQNKNGEHKETPENSVQDNVVEDCKEEKKLNKRERKEERRKKANKTEKKDKDSKQVLSDAQTSEASDKPSKKKRKHQMQDEELEQEKHTKKRKRKHVEEEDESRLEEDNENDEDEDQPPVKKTKFNWTNVITEVLKSKGEITLKKLRKKVLAEYIFQMGEPRSEEKLYSKFDKKVTKNSDFKVLKDRVKLVTSS